MDSSADDQHGGPGSIVAADRAGAMVSQQVQAILQQATMQAQQSRDGAEAEAEAIRGATLRALQAVIAELEALADRLEQEEIDARLAPLRDYLSRELDDLRALAQPLDDQVRGEDGAPAADAQASNEAAASNQTAAAPPPPSAAAPTDEARRRVAASTDDELVDQYEAARTALKSAERGRGDEDPQYWSTYLEAIVQEAAQREDFGAHLEGEDLPKRDRKRELRRYQELLEAREQLRGAGST